ncbi:hypothetical protein GO491_06305 [Flavobacteriaceae bacterium Ap0902]|nr:hypothetical protein [Flavobacteriaceae bacterium Ap0902]
MKWLNFILILFPFILLAQVEEVGVITDSVAIESNPFTADIALDSKNPLKASLYSAVLPGLGQVYNERYWKIPIVWGALGTGIGFTLYYNDLKNKYREAFIAELNGEEHQYSGILDAQRLGSIQDDMRRNRDYAIAITILVYALNVIDATVDAHLYEIRKDKDLSVDPLAFADPMTGETHLGLSLKLDL